MDVYKLKSDTLKQVESKPFALEREIQNLVESNIEEIFGLEFVASELSIGDYRLDTLAYDRESSCFVIIEYKKGHSYSVIDQGYSYLSTMLQKKADFVLEYNETKEDVTKKIVFWDLPKILIIDLKRWNENGNRNNKLVKADINDVDLSKYVIGYNKLDNVYDLYGICNHSGGSMGGHYTAYIKNANNKWYEFNDTMVNEINEDKLISEKSYCFFYRKKK